MIIHFSRTRAPLLILDQFDHHVGTITTTRRDITRKCECCGQPVWVKNVISGYNLTIKDRYWGQGRVLRPKGKGGMSGTWMRRLKDIKALATDRLEGSS